MQLQKSPSPTIIEEILKLEAFKDIKQHIVPIFGTKSQMTLEYLRDGSTMLAVVSAVREGGLKRHFSAEQGIFKLIFALDRIDYAKHGTYHQMYLNNLLRREKSIPKDLITNKYSTSISGGSFSTVH